VLETVRARETRRLARDARETTVQEGIAHRVARRHANALKAALSELPDATLVEFDCECAQGDCERSVKAPLYVYRRLLEAGNQYLLHRGHHAFPRYRTIVAFGMMRIEEPIEPIA
jgi:hypothetical protein